MKLSHLLFNLLAMPGFLSIFVEPMSFAGPRQGWTDYPGETQVYETALEPAQHPVTSGPLSSPSGICGVPTPPPIGGIRPAYIPGGDVMMVLRPLPPAPMFSAFITRPTNLTDSQLEFLGKAKSDYLAQTGRLVELLQLEEHQLRDELLQSQLDRKKISDIQIAIRDTRANLEQIFFEHLADIAEMLTAEQRKQMKVSMLRNEFEPPSYPRYTNWSGPGK
jgi:hypothetical protein